MNDPILRLTEAMIRYDQGDPMRVHHFLKVYAFASAIGTREGLDEHTQFILEAAALVHDIGVRLAVETYGSTSGRFQEMVGPAEAEAMLRELDFPEDIIERVSYLVGHHHTYDRIDSPDYQILVEADFLVNLYEGSISPFGQQDAYNKLFRTETGKEYCRLLYPVFDPEDTETA